MIVPGIYALSLERFGSEVQSTLEDSDWATVGYIVACFYILGSSPTGRLWPSDGPCLPIVTIPKLAWAFWSILWLVQPSGTRFESSYKRIKRENNTANFKLGSPMHSQPRLDSKRNVAQSMSSVSRRCLLSFPSPRVFSSATRRVQSPLRVNQGLQFAMNDATTSLLTEHFSYTPLVSLLRPRSVFGHPSLHPGPANLRDVRRPTP